MRFYRVTDPEFRPYGMICEDYPVDDILSELKKTPVTNEVVYTALDETLQRLPAAARASANLYGGMPIEMGWCNGHNHSLNCLEYHRSSEFNLGATEFVLLVAKREDIVNGTVDSSLVKAFVVPAGLMVEVYATTLHYAPCHVSEKDGFQVLIILPLGTNTEKPEAERFMQEDQMLFARNKWLLAHADTEEAKNGAYVGIIGPNLSIENEPGKNS